MGLLAGLAFKYHNATGQPRQRRPKTEVFCRVDLMRVDPSETGSMSPGCGSICRMAVNQCERDCRETQRTIPLGQESSQYLLAHLAKTIKAKGRPQPRGRLGPSFAFSC